MPKLTKFTALLYILFVLQACQSDDVKDTNDIVEDPLMELLSADSTGIYFNKQLTSSRSRHGYLLQIERLPAVGFRNARIADQHRRHSIIIVNGV